MNISSAVFDCSAPNLDFCPDESLPEFAFIGRSNVGKSSLLNLIVGQHRLAKVSDLPGKTRLLNFFVVNGRWRLVDLPGYGYAHGSQTERSDFNVAVADYLEQRQTLRHTFVLIDSRLPSQKIDRAFLDWIAAAGLPFSVVFTKIDKQSASQTQASIARFKAEVLAPLRAGPQIFLASAKTKAGRTELLACLSQLLADG
jgi:GTP-binding protein